MPGAPFALLLAEPVVAAAGLCARWIGRPKARAVMAVVAAALAIRFAVYAEKSGPSFRALTVPYSRFVAAVRRADPSGGPGPVALTPADVENIPAAYYDVAAGGAFCGSPIHVVVP